MYINRVAALLLLLIFVFSPSLQNWVLEDGSAWYRPYLVWVVMAAVVFWSQRGRDLDLF